METTDGNQEHMLSAEEVVNNVDLLTMILLRVPAKSLVRFKCISKHWLSLISDSKFSNNHTLKNLKLSVLGLYFNSRPLINFKKKTQNGLPNLDFLNTSDGMNAVILHSCNGLMLCARGLEIIVCNPTTHKFKVISSSSSSLSIRKHWFIAFYPMRSPHYKVVLLGYSSCLDLQGYDSVLFYEADIYSSDTGTWRNITILTKRNPVYNVHCAGSIYWTDDYNNLTRFDIDKAVDFQMPTNYVVSEESTVLWFGEYGEHLSLIRTTSPDHKLKFQILEMDMDNFSWTIRYNVDIKPVVDTFNIMVQSVKVLGLMGGGEKQTPILVFLISDKVISYNLKSNYFEILRDGIDDFYRPHANNFIASLASV